MAWSLCINSCLTFVVPLEKHLHTSPFFYVQFVRIVFDRVARMETSTLRSLFFLSCKIVKLPASSLCMAIDPCAFVLISYLVEVSKILHPLPYKVPNIRFRLGFVLLVVRLKTRVEISHLRLDFWSDQT